MIKVFGDRKAYPGVVAYLKIELTSSINKTKTPIKMVRDKLFSLGYMSTHVLAASARGGCTVSTSNNKPKPICPFHATPHAKLFFRRYIRPDNLTASDSF